MAVVVEKHPEKIQDLLGYQTLIVEARREYDSDTWLGYDRRFRQNAAASPGTVWARIDPTLWNMAFTGQAKSRRCKYCFSLSHQSEECDWAPANPSTQPMNATPPTNTRFNPRARADQVCYSWNHSPEPSCAFPGCKYQHVCLYCAKDPQATNKEHKAMYCNRRRNKTACRTSAANEARQCTALPPLLNTAGTIMTILSSWHCHVALLITHAVFFSSLGFGHFGSMRCCILYEWLYVHYYKYSQERASTADNEYIIDGIVDDPLSNPTDR